MRPPEEQLPDVLRRIVERRRLWLDDHRAGAMAAAPGDLPSDPARGDRFLDALRRNRRAIIAEIKLGSPKLGDLRGTFDPEEQARAYAAAGASALSVVVESEHFFGGYDLLSRCAAASGLPALAKDFVVGEEQLDMAAQAGASAVLLIAAIHSAGTLEELAARARTLGMVPLIETHSDADFGKLRGSSWELVGINNRDLRTFEVDLERSIRCLELLPSSALKVAESGIHSSRDIDRLEEAGFDAFLIGERLVKSGDPAGALRELLAGAGRHSPDPAVEPSEKT